MKIVEKNDKKKRTEYISNALNTMNIAEKLNKNCAVMYYHKGVLNFAEGNIAESILDLEKAIDKSDDNIP